MCLTEKFEFSLKNLKFSSAKCVLKIRQLDWGIFPEENAREAQVAFSR